MSYILGIHLGHHSSCALVSNGILISAIQQERISRRKHDGFEYLSNRIPINECLSIAGITVDDLDLIVSSFQAISNGGFGLHQPIIDPNFNLFEPFDKRHFVISHHLAHAYCAFGSSGFSDSAVIVCDLAGSSTLTGKDFYKSFKEWYGELISSEKFSEILTENLSIYDANCKSMELKYREFCTSHNAPESFICSVASLYDNVTRCVFRNENAHGQLMALAAYANTAGEAANDKTLQVDDILEELPDNRVIFKNNWQNKVRWGSITEEYAYLASICQLATEKALLAYAKKTRELSDSKNLAVAGGVFLNILANTRIAESSLFENYFVPSAPHDAGISVGCAFYGDSIISNCHSKVSIANDRLGIQYDNEVIESALYKFRYVVHYTKSSIKQVASMLAKGSILSRWAGRSEFGPRALGGRSILASPLLEKNKQLLNSIKGRQSWRPVAPIVLQERLEEFFLGKKDSPYMTFSHQIRPQYVPLLSALSHPDETSRAQTLSQDVDGDLYLLLTEFEAITGFPILVNTSMNGPNEPIIETPLEAIEFYISHTNIDALLLNSWLVIRKGAWEDEALRHAKIRMSASCLLSSIFANGSSKFFVTRKSLSLDISESMYDLLISLKEGKSVDKVFKENFDIESPESLELYHLILSGIVSIVED